MDENMNGTRGTQPQVVPAAAPKKKGKLLKILAVLLVILVTAGGVWYWQQQQIKDLQEQVSQLQTEKNKAINDLETLKSEAAKAKENNVTVTYGSVVRDTDRRYGNGKANVIIIPFTAVNSGTGDQTIKASDFKLTDTKDSVLAAYADTPELVTAIKAFGLPDKATVFTTAKVGAGEKVSGSLVFWNTDTSNTSFKAVYNGKTGELKVAKTTKVCDRDNSICETN